jgi:hypothetical protein
MKYRTDMREMKPDDEFAAVVTLVHGTFAKNAVWTSEDSAFSKVLRSSLSGPVLIKTFEWSGKNSHRARIKAGAQLAELLKNLMGIYPNAKHCIVGHSHGGNVILYALESSEVCDKVACVVFLATPFIVAYPRDAKTILRLLKFVFRFGVFVPWLFGSVCFAVSMTAALGFGPVLLFSIFGTVATYLLWRIDKWWFAYHNETLPKVLESRSQEIVQRVSTTISDGVPFFNARSRRDEAYGYLTVLDRISEGPSNLWRPAFFAWFVGITTGLFMGGVGYYLSIATDNDYWEKIGSIGFMLFALPCIAALSFLLVAVVSQLIMVGWMKLFRGHGLGYGDRFYENWLAHISTSMSPIEHRCCTEREYTPSGKGLRHSMLYTNERVIEDIAAWIRQVLCDEMKTGGETKSGS